MDYLVVINLLVFAGIMVFLTRFRRPAFSLSQHILAGLVAVVVFGFALQFAYSGNPGAI